MTYPKGFGYGGLALAGLAVTTYGVHQRIDLMGLAACIMASVGVVAGGGAMNRWADLRDTLKSQAPSSSSSQPSR